MTFIKQQARAVLAAVLTALVFVVLISFTSHADKPSSAKHYAVAISTSPALVLTTAPPTTAIGLKETAKQLVCNNIYNLGVAVLGRTCFELGTAHTRTHAAFAQPNQ